ncbi:hypothetical protein EXIGLDRAFT_835648 [Exidia glandulosa HHB12029]|uniref:Uncharacterized protein n=1 Tax=Exidia glandulosa HHB12029 TaxID=1314781 RepID=A0A165IIW4_EXIGL|nr:hypothetical protein EXIGLDRAFT_835648 [Exidia glandulosa HHB12029]
MSSVELQVQKPIQSQPMSASKMQVQPDLEQNQTVQTVDGGAQRIRGGGGGKDCFMGIVECFLCFECCKVKLGNTTVCCECFADIICCPCEMCC